MSLAFWLPQVKPAAEPGSDAALVAAFRAGNAAAFDALFNKHARAVLRFVRSLTGSAADAEDITQETFLAAVSGLHTVREATSVRPFLLGVAARIAQNRHRRGARREKLAPTHPAEPGELEQQAETGASLADTVALRDALQKLGDADRAAFLLIAQTGLTHREAATALGVPVGVLRWRVARATGALRRYLSDGDAVLSSQTNEQAPSFSPTQPEVLPHVP